jgi:hypothetical protein
MLMAQRVISTKLKAFIKPSSQAMCNSNLNGSLFIMVTATVRGKQGMYAKSLAIRLNFDPLQGFIRLPYMRAISMSRDGAPAKIREGRLWVN